MGHACRAHRGSGGGATADVEELSGSEYCFPSFATGDENGSIRQGGSAGSLPGCH